MKLSAEDRLGMSPEEIKTLEAMPEDGSVDDEAQKPPAEQAATGAAGGDDGGAAAAGEAGITAEQAAAALEEAEPIKPKAFEVGNVDDIAEQRKTLRSQKAEVEAKWSGGHITDEERAAKIADIDDKLDDLLIRSTRASTLREINEQNARDAEKRAADDMNAEIVRVIRQAQADKTIDYPSDPLAQAQFDGVMAAIKASPAGGKMPVRELVDQTHRAVLAIRGTPAQATAAPGQRRQAPEPPPSLAFVPAAASQAVSDDMLGKFRTLSGDEAEAFMASLPEREQRRLLKLADSMV